MNYNDEKPIQSWKAIDITHGYFEFSAPGSREG